MAGALVRGPPAQTDSARDDLRTRLECDEDRQKRVRTTSKIIPTIHTDRDMRVLPFCVLRSHMLLGRQVLVTPIFDLHSPLTVARLDNHAEPAPKVLALLAVWFPRPRSREEVLLAAATDRPRGRRKSHVAPVDADRRACEHGRNRHHGGLEWMRAVRDAARLAGHAAAELGHLGGAAERGGDGARELDARDGGGIAGLGRGEGNRLLRLDLLAVVEGILLVV